MPSATACLFRSQDGGISWDQPLISPGGVLHQFRVVSISRGHDGALYVAGTSAAPTSDAMVVRLTTQSDPLPASVYLSAVGEVGRSFVVGTFRTLADGRAIAESLNGSDLLYYIPNVSNTSASTWTAYSPGTQILDLAVHNDRFWGVGSTIAEPPQVFLPPLGGGAMPYEFVIGQPQRSGPWTGELWGLAIDDERIVAVGVDQDNDIGRIFVSTAPRNMGQYVETSVSQVLGNPTGRTWARGVCMRGERIAVVGERQPINAGTGIVLLSLDGGASFQPVTPSDVPSSVSKCVFEPDGTLVVAGAGGFVGVLPSDPHIFADGFDPVR